MQNSTNRNSAIERASLETPPQPSVMQPTLFHPDPPLVSFERVPTEPKGSGLPWTTREFNVEKARARAAEMAYEERHPKGTHSEIQ